MTLKVIVLLLGAGGIATYGKPFSPKRFYAYLTCNEYRLIYITDFNQTIRVETISRLL